MIKKCGNCKRRCFRGWDGMPESCMGYSMTGSEQEEIEEAARCGAYEEGTPDCLIADEDEYSPSATAGDYGPGCPWNAPGMSVRDFI